MSVPERIWKLGQERAAAREAKDFARADRLRDELAQLGWEIFDLAGTFELRERLRYKVAEDFRHVEPTADLGEIAIAMIVSGFQNDAVEAVKSVRTCFNGPIVLLCLDDVGVLEEVIDEKTTVIKVAEKCGWGEAANTLLAKVIAKFIVIMDPSTRFSGDAITSALAQLRESTYLAVGWRGGLINVEDGWRTVDDRGPGEVDVLFSYFLALDRESAREAGGFNTRAIYYRNADIEFSLKLRHAGGRLLQMELPLEQDRHHGYHDVDQTFREVQSKKNYDRILARFRGKNAILSPRR